MADELDTPSRDQLSKIGNDWLERIKESEKREKDWRDDAENAEKAYSCAKGESPDFNILHANIETIVPAVYNSTPNPDIRPRHNNPDDVAKEVADALERAISTAIDDDVLDVEVEDVAQDAEMAGRGVLWLKLRGEITGEDVQNEAVEFECVSWRDYREGPAKRWKDVPWVARRHTITGKELLRISDEALWEAQLNPTDDASALEASDHDIWEIWDKETRQIFMVMDESGRVLKIIPDWLRLKTFFPMPEPMQPITLTGKRTPICPYSAYRKLADELDRITKRINKIISGLKVRGLIAGGVAQDLENLANADDNTIVTAENLEALVAAGGGLDKAIAWWPVDMAIAVLRELYQQREQTKQTIYEVTGISDIVRGASNAQETLGAQEIKSQWGSMRIRRRQRAIERMIRDTFKLLAEIFSMHFSPERIMQMAGMQLSPEAMMALAQPFDNFRIDVESDSTIRSDLSQRKGEMGQFLQTTGGYLQVAQAIVEKQPAAAVPLAEILSAFTRNFNLGKQAEDAIDQMVKGAKEPQPPQPNPEAEAKQAEMQLKAQEAQGKAQAEAARIALDQQKAATDAEFRGEELLMKGRELDMKEREMAFKEREFAMREQEMAIAQANSERDFAFQAEGAEYDRNMNREAAEMEARNMFTEMVGPANAQTVEAIAAGNEQVMQAVMQMAQTLSAGQEKILRVMSAPKEVIRDQNGRPVGVRPVIEQMEQ